ncbi:MAG: VOC family protein [Pyrinomonadaceae bacterium]|nr:VOC family protein [Pyrinomonadaceae bacterium]
MNNKNSPKTAVCLWFDGHAEEAAEFYTSLVPGSEIVQVTRLREDQPALVVEFLLGGVPFQALNGGPKYKHSEAASIVVSTKDQSETDRLWDALTADGGSESRCAWLKDRFGVSWQIVPEVLNEYINAPHRAAAERAMEAMLGMNKIIIADLEAAFKGE